MLFDLRLGRLPKTADFPKVTADKEPERIGARVDVNAAEVKTRPRWGPFKIIRLFLEYAGPDRKRRSSRRKAKTRPGRALGKREPAGRTESVRNVRSLARGGKR